MSELKAYRVYTRRDEGAWGYDPFAEPTDVELNDEQVYIKSEADRYIAYQKMKRCLAMADLCFRECQTYRALIERGEEHFSKMDFYGRWNKIWLILAEKFKEAK